MVAYEQRIQTFCLLILTTLALAAAMHYFSAVLIPFVLAIFLTYCMTPVVDLQRRWLRFPRSVAIVSTILLGCVALFAVGLLITGAVGEISAHAKEYQVKIDELLKQTMAKVPMEKLGLKDADLSGTLLEKFSGTAATLLAGTVSGVMSIVSNGILVIIFMIFMMAGRATGDERRGGIWTEIESRTKRYIITMVFISGTTGLLVGVTLSILGVQFAWMFGFLTFLLNFIPNIGSIVATLLPLPVVLLGTPELSPVAKVLAVVLPTAIQFLIGNLLQPKIMGQSLDLHPVTVLLSLIFFGIIWGIMGMFLATPITAIIKILLERFQKTRSAAMLMSGRLDALTDGGFEPAPPEGARVEVAASSRGAEV